MREINVSLLGVLQGLSGDDIVKLAAARYAEKCYGIDIDSEELDEIESCIDTTEGDILVDIQNTFANVDRTYGDEDDDYDDDYYDCEDEDSDYDDDYDDYDDEDDDDDYWDSDEEDEVDAETQRLIEENRRKNEMALGL